LTDGRLQPFCCARPLAFRERAGNNNPLGFNIANFDPLLREPLTLRLPMEEIKELVKHHQAIIAAVIAGTCAIVAAIIRREKMAGPSHEKKPIVKLGFLSFISLVLGAGLLAGEYFVLPADPESHLRLDNPDPGSLLMLGGWLFVAAGVVWGFVNLIRLRTAHKKGKELASVPVNPGGTPSSIPVVQPVATPVARRRT
jgi:hypothetical protein